MTVNKDVCLPGTSDAIERAAAYADAAHEGQTYGEDARRGLPGYPYIFHVLHAYKVAQRFAIADEGILCAILLHDVLEDTDREYLEIYDLFGPRVAMLVDAVTNMSGANRRERHEKTYPRIAACPGATGVKLCDRIANVEHSLKYDSPQIGMYRKEHAGFETALRTNEWSVLWSRLDVLMRRS